MTTKPEKKKFSKRQIKFYEAHESKTKQIADDLPDALLNLMENHEFTEHQKTQYSANYAKILEENGKGPLSINERNNLVKYNLKMLKRLREEMSEIQGVYNMISDSIKFRERMALNLDVERSTLMDLLGYGGRHLPLWIGKVGEMPPARAGRILDNSMPDIGELVGAYAKGMWILAEVKAIPSEKRLIIRDVDDDKKIYCEVIRDHILLLPLYRVDPKRSPFAIFEKHSVVLALYPQTTCFYKGIVESPPFSSDDPYLITFEDEDYEGGYAPAVHVPQRYVLMYRDHPASSSEINVEASDSSATEEDTPEPEQPLLPIRRRFKVRDSDELTDDEGERHESCSSSHRRSSEDTIDKEQSAGPSFRRGSTSRSNNAADDQYSEPSYEFPFSSPGAEDESFDIGDNDEDFVPH
uniref:SGF29 C-terminal domain-containing protein n=1 Tax=Panagrolaimus davidi TaxID=227884 RepID=A0A914PCZ2_9BILA